jgi:hypothetical protein
VADVVKIRDDVVLENDTDPSLIEDAEEFLRQVKAGRIKAFAIASVVEDKLPNTRYNATGAYKFELATAVGILHHRIYRLLLDE